MGLNFFLQSGIENIISGWIPTYTNLYGIATKKQAAIFGTAFWLTFTVARFSQAAIKMKVSTGLKRLTELGIISAILNTIFSYLNWHVVAASFCAITQGVSVSGIFTLSLAIAS